MTRAFLLLFAAAGPAFAQLSPAEAVKRMTLPPGFTAEVVAHEPTIRQPLSISFDHRGRLWVLQYLQYPAPAGLKAVSQDQYLRTVWDRVPEPPPKGPKGADRLTILSDLGPDGIYRKSKDFVSGLNLASGFCLGGGGVYVVQPPYLLFYPDADSDDVPDRDPDVLLTGFGMEDSHAFANSLQWGPDGWLYGAQGSTVTAKIRNPADPKQPPVEFQQGIWRYHPKTKRFELFSEGGGNTWGLDYDKTGQWIAGTNWGGFAMLHQFPGAYYVKGFAKHGPLHNPHAYGYLGHVPYTGFQGGHVTCGGIVYQADAYPPEFRDQYIAGNLLSNVVNWHTMTPKGASFIASHGGTLLNGNDPWFRPVDLAVGPDGCVYVADWYDRRANHVDPVDNWDKSNGRVYRISYKGTPRVPAFDLSKESTAELVKRLEHPNAWWRRESRRILSERMDARTETTLKFLIRSRERASIEALWALQSADRLSCVMNTGTVLAGSGEAELVALRLASANFPRWTASEKSFFVRGLGRWFADSTDPRFAAEIACFARRCGPEYSFDAVRSAAGRLHEPDETTELLLWWAMEAAAAVPGELLRTQAIPTGPPFAGLHSRVARRALAPDVPDGTAVLVKGLQSMELAPHYLRGLEAATTSGWPTKPSAELLAELRKQNATFLLARAGDVTALDEFRSKAADAKREPRDRAAAIQTLSSVKDAKSADLFRDAFKSGPPQVRTAALVALDANPAPDTTDLLMTAYTPAPQAEKPAILAVLTNRPAGAALVLKAIDAKQITVNALSLDRVRTIHATADDATKKLIAKHYGAIGPATAGEKQARINALNTTLGRLKGDAVAGKAHFTQHCAKCHTLHGDGGKAGPDLTASDRKSRAMLLHSVIDPSAVIRPEFVAHAVALTDGRKLTGVVTDATTDGFTLFDAEGKKAVVRRADVEDLKPLSTSLMPDKLLDALSDQQIADLFAYVQSDPPTKGRP